MLHISATAQAADTNEIHSALNGCIIRAYGRGLKQLRLLVKQDQIETILRVAACEAAFQTPDSCAPVSPTASKGRYRREARSSLSGPESCAAFLRQPMKSVVRHQAEPSTAKKTGFVSAADRELSSVGDGCRSRVSKRPVLAGVSLISARSSSNVVNEVFLQVTFVLRNVLSLDAANSARICMGKLFAAA